MKLKKKDGISLNFILIPAISIAVIFCLFMIKSKQIEIVNDFIDDGLVMSNLAAATVDLNEYGQSNTIVNNDFNKSFDQYKKALKNNLRLDNNFVPQTSNLIDGGITIEIFTIYNVNGNDIHMIKRQRNGNIIKQVYPNAVGTMKTPDGVKIETTTVYSKIGMNVKGFMNGTTYVYKDKTVDITDKE